MYPIKEHSITKTYKSFHAITLKDVWENAFFVLMDKLLRCAMADNEVKEAIYVLFKGSENLGF